MSRYHVVRDIGPWGLFSKNCCHLKPGESFKISDGAFRVNLHLEGVSYQSVDSEKQSA